MGKYKCKICNRNFRPYKKNENKERYVTLCSVCRKQEKDCLRCGKRHYNQGSTCSKECATQLKKQSWLKSCGTEHNFSKESRLRKDWEDRLLKEEGIINVFQRDNVKAKIIETIKKKFKSRLLDDNIEYTNISQSYYWRTRHHFNFIIKYGYDRWCDKNFNNNSKINAYRFNVWGFTMNSIRLYGEKYLGMTFDEIKKYNKTVPYKEKLSIDHKYSTINGFLNNIDPKIIGSIYNIELLTTSENSAKNSKCSIDIEELFKLYNKQYNENKINKK